MTEKEEKTIKIEKIKALRKLIAEENSRIKLLNEQLDSSRIKKEIFENCLIEICCGYCMGKGYTMVWDNVDENNHLTPCKQCNGTGIK